MWIQLKTKLKKEANIEIARKRITDKHASLFGLLARAKKSFMSMGKGYVRLVIINSAEMFS